MISKDEKRETLAQLVESGGDLRAVSQRTGVKVATLRRWWQQYQAERGERIAQRLGQLHEQLADDALQLAQAITGRVEDAPLNQLATALGTVLDRFLKLEEHLGDSGEEQVIRIEYQYPDGSLHDRPLWAAGDLADADALPGGGLRAALREDRDGQTGDYRNGAARRDDLVAGPDLHDGGAGLAGFEDDSPAVRHD